MFDVDEFNRELTRVSRAEYGSTYLYGEMAMCEVGLSRPHDSDASWVLFAMVGAGYSVRTHPHGKGPAPSDYGQDNPGVAMAMAARFMHLDQEAATGKYTGPKCEVIS